MSFAAVLAFALAKVATGISSAPWGGVLQAMSPDMAIAVSTAGLLLIFLEMNQPGRILPGACGLFLLLGGMAALAHRVLSVWAVIALLASATLAVVNWRLPLPVWLLCLAVAAWVGGMRALVVSPGPKVSLLVALFCGGLSGGAGVVLSRVAYHARRAKAVH